MYNPSSQGRDSICSIPPFSFYLIKVLINDQSDCSKADSYVLKNKENGFSEVF